MYDIKSLYEPAIDALHINVSAERYERWMVSIAFWMGRQQMYSIPDYWRALGARILVELPEAEQDELLPQLNKEEDTAVDNVAGWPDIPPTLQSYLNSWLTDAPEIDLDALKAAAVIKVNKDVSARRAIYITDGVGMDLVYIKKLQEAQARIADPDIDESKIMHIVNEANLNGISILDMAEAIIETEAQWAAISAPIELKRMAAKKAIDEATTPNEVSAAASIDWTT